MDERVGYERSAVAAVPAGDTCAARASCPSRASCAADATRAPRAAGTSRASSAAETSCSASSARSTLRLHSAPCAKRTVQLASFWYARLARCLGPQLPGVMLSCGMPVAILRHGQRRLDLQQLADGGSCGF